MASISLEHIRKTYEDGVTVIPDLNLEIRDREFLILVVDAPRFFISLEE